MAGLGLALADALDVHGEVGLAVVEVRRDDARLALVARLLGARRRELARQSLVVLLPPRDLKPQQPRRLDLLDLLLVQMRERVLFLVRLRHRPRVAVRPHTEICLKLNFPAIPS